MPLFSISRINMINELAHTHAHTRGWNAGVAATHGEAVPALQVSVAVPFVEVFVAEAVGGVAPPGVQNSHGQLGTALHCLCLE